MVEALQTLRGVCKLVAAGVVAEIGSFSLVPSEHSSGSRVSRGGITKTGNSHVRRLIVEAAWAYQHRPAIGPTLRQRQRHLPAAVTAIAWKAQHRLHHRYRRLTGRGKPRPQVITAIGRELLGFIWAIGVEVERPERLAATA